MLTFAVRLIIVAALALVSGFGVFVSVVRPGVPVEATRAEAIVALTGGPARVADAVKLLDDGHAGRLLITGVHRDVGERDIARVVPRAAQHLHCCIDLDHRALNTVGNAIEAGRWVRHHGFRSVLVVTSDFHMPRTLLEMRRELPAVELKPHAVRTDVTRLRQWWTEPSSLKILLAEYAKYLLAVLHVRLEPPTGGAHRAQRAAAG